MSTDACRLRASASPSSSRPSRVALCMWSTPVSFRRRSPANAPRRRPVTLDFYSRRCTSRFRSRGRHGDRQRSSVHLQYEIYPVYSKIPTKEKYLQCTHLLNYFTSSRCTKVNTYIYRMLLLEYIFSFYLLLDDIKLILVTWTIQ